jgi:hypothetical protein
MCSSKCISLLSPQPDETIPALPYDKDTFFILVYGTCHRDKNLTGYLIDLEDDELYPGTLLKGTGAGLSWALSFPGLPSQTADYLLVLAEQKSTLARKEAFAFPISTAPPVKSKPRGRRLLLDDNPITIMTPGGGGTVCSDVFYSSGTYIHPDTLSATLMPGNYQGVVVPTDPGTLGCWTFKFTSITQGDGYTLTVSSTDAGVTPATVGDLTASQGVCNL